MPKITIKDNISEFQITVDEETQFNLQAESSGVREEWLHALGSYCQFDGEERLVGMNRSAALFGKHKFEEKYVHFSEYGLEQPIISDCEMVRVAIPGDTAVKINMSTIFKLLKDLVGKDLSRFSMPVFVNEPTSMLMKPAELMFFNENTIRAADEEDEAKRMLYMAIDMTTQFYCFHKRSGKPFNPLLGETYEVVTPDFKFFAEMVSHHPPVSSFCC